MGGRRLLGTVDDTADVTLEEGLDRVVEHPERNEGVLVLLLNALRRLLEAGEHGALAAGEVLAGAAVLAELRHDLLHEGELVVHEGEGLGEVLRAVVAVEVRDGALEGEEVAQDRRALAVLHGKQPRGVRRLGEHAALDDLVGARAGEREARVEAALDLGEVVAGDGRDLVDGLLARDHHPYASGALGAELLHDGLEVEHEVGVSTDELTDLVHHEEQAELASALGGARLRVVANLVSETFDGEVGSIGAVKPPLGLLPAHDVRLHERGDDVVAEEVVLGAGVEPALAVHALEGGAEGVRLALGVHELLQARELEVLAVEAEVIVEDAREGALEDVRVLLAHRLVVHVEEDGLRGDVRAAVHLGGDHAVFELAVEVVERSATRHLTIGEEVREHLEEVGLTGAKEAADPDADLVRGDVERALVGVEEGGEVTRELTGDHVLGELLLEAGLVLLRDLDHAIDVPVDVALEHVLNAHGHSLEQVEGPVIISVADAVEEVELGTVVLAGVQQHHGHVRKDVLGVLEDAVGAHDGIDPAHAGDQKNVAAGLMGLVVHSLHESLRRGDLLEALQKGTGAAAALEVGNLVQDAALLADLEEDVPEVAAHDAAREPALV